MITIDEMVIQKAEANANATKIRILSEADTNKLRLTKNYLKLEAINSIANSSKVHNTNCRYTLDHLQWIT